MVNKWHLTMARQLRQPTGFLGKVVANMLARGNSREYDNVIYEMNLQAKDKVFEIGYGHGAGIHRIWRDYHCDVSGIDFSRTMFNMASKRNRDLIKSKKVELYYGDFLTYKMKPEQYDKIFCLNVIYFWESLEIPFAKIFSGLKAGGLFCFSMTRREDLNRMKSTPDGIFNKYTIEEVVAGLKSAGFKEVGFKFDRTYVIRGRK